MKFKKGFRLNANPNHGKDGKFTSKGAFGRGSGAIAGGPGVYRPKGTAAIGGMGLPPALQRKIKKKLGYYLGKTGFKF